MINLKLKNGKYYHGQYENNKENKGWFIGSFLGEDNKCKTNKLEVMYCHHHKGDIVANHYHKEKVELLIIIQGSAKYNINGTDIFLTKGDFLFIDINNIICGVFLEDSEIFAIHSPSIPSDKFKP